MEDTIRFELPITNADSIVARYLRNRPSHQCKRWFGAARVDGPWKHQYARVKPINGQRGKALLIEHSPKYLFGHNVFGSSDIQSQVWACIEHVQDRFGL